MRGVRRVQHPRGRGRVTSVPILDELGGPRTAGVRQAVTIETADARGITAHRSLRHTSFVVAQGRFAGSDLDDADDDARTVVLVARTPDGEVVGGVRLSPCHEPDIGWWAGSRLVVARRAPRGTGAALVRAACARALDEGVLRFDACVQADKAAFFTGLGWERIADVDRFGGPHVTFRFPIDRLARQAAVKAPLGDLLGGLHLGGPGFVGDDGAPVPGTDVVAATDAIVPAMVERDPWWAGWCGVLVNLNDLTAMGARPLGLLDALAAPTASLARRVLAGVRDAAEAYGVPVLGGHTQLGAPAALSVTALGRTRAPVRGGGGRVGDEVHLTADLGGRWRPGYHGSQWDSTTHRSPAQLRACLEVVPRTAPGAAKDVSMAGLVGTLGMLAEASGTGAELDVARVPVPDGARLADWCTSFPGFAVLTTGPRPHLGTAPVTTARCARLTADPGVRLRWPDGVTTTALGPSVTALGPAATTALEDARG
ncbi:AIR synthase [Nitriliruptoraceae bacterium ZYF776]|nr:AIR synthase [Profundirhabdus halotolerans]